MSTKDTSPLESHRVAMETVQRVANDIESIAYAMSILGLKVSIDLGLMAEDLRIAAKAGRDALGTQVHERFVAAQQSSANLLNVALNFAKKPAVYAVEPCRYCGGECPSDHDNACDGFSGDIDGLYVPR